MIYYEPQRANPTGGIYQQENVDLQFSPHLHDSFELICVRQGELNVSVDNRIHTVLEGQAILIFPNQIHVTLPSDGNRTYLCIFQNSLVGEFYCVAGNSEVDSPVFDFDAADLVERITAAEGARYRLKACLYEVVYRFDRQCGVYRARAGRQMDILGKILFFISTHYTEHISMQSVADTLGYDHHYLSTVFRKYLHTTFHAVLNEYRISQAKRLLVTGNRTVADVAYECGYNSLVSFNRNFKNIAGMTPSEFRMRST